MYDEEIEHYDSLIATSSVKQEYIVFDRNDNLHGRCVYGLKRHRYKAFVFNGTARGIVYESVCNENWFHVYTCSRENVFNWICLDADTLKRDWRVEASK